ncbi:hypothetical protein D3C80_1695880 [compost metagenome]
MLYTRFNPRTTAQLVLRYWVLYGALFFAAAVALQFNSWLFLLMLFLVGFVGAFVDIAIVTTFPSITSQPLLVMPFQGWLPAWSLYLRGRQPSSG